jgi:hypothetical protein
MIIGIRSFWRPLRSSYQSIRTTLRRLKRRHITTPRPRHVDVAKFEHCNVSSCYNSVGRAGQVQAKGLLSGPERLPNCE